MQKLFPLSSAIPGANAPLRGNDAASHLLYARPHRQAIPASPDGKMQLPPGHFPLRIKPRRIARTQTSCGKASHATTTHAEVYPANRMSTAKCTFHTEGYFISQSVSELVARLVAFVEPSRLTDVGSASNSFPTESLSTRWVYTPKLHRGCNDRQVELSSSLSVRFAGVAEDKTLVPSDNTSYCSKRLTNCRRNSSSDVSHVGIESHRQH